MGKSAPSAPATPDPAKTAQAQAAANKEAAISSANINMINQQTPYGSLEYTQRGTASDGTPQYTATQTLSPGQQQLYDLTNQAAQKYGQTANTQLDAVSDRLAQPLDFGSLGAAPVANEQTRQQVYDSIIQRNQPLATQQYDQLQTRLANQGLSDPGSQAYRAAIDEYYRGQNDFGLAAQNAALGQQQAMYGMEANARDRAVNEMAQSRSIPLNELAAMLSGAQVQSPSFVNAPQQQIAPADIMGATYGSANLNQNLYNQQSATQRQNIQGLYGLLGSSAQAGGYYFGGSR